MMFRKCIPYMEKLDIIFSHMEDPPKEIIWKFVNNGPSSRSTTGHWGYEQTESPTVHQGSASLEAQIDKLLDELLESGVQELDDDYINAVDLLRDPIILKRYSKLSSMEKKIGFMRKLRTQVSYCCLVASCIINGELNKLLQYFEEIDLLSVLPTSDFYSVIC